MRWTLLAAVAAVVVLGGSVGSSTSAQSAGIKKSYSYRSGGYTTCGEFRYWRDGRCVDARTSPPDVSRPRR